MHNSDALEVNLTQCHQIGCQRQFNPDLHLTTSSQLSAFFRYHLQHFGPGLTTIKRYGNDECEKMCNRDNVINAAEHDRDGSP